MITITALYSALAGLFYAVLSLRVSFLRMNLGQTLGDGGHSALSVRIRQHANFAEYAPITLILMGFVEALGAAPWAVHAAGLAFLGSRLGHALGLERGHRGPGRNQLRYWSMVVCYALLIALSLGCLYLLATWG